MIVGRKQLFTVLAAVACVTMVSFLFLFGCSAETVPEEDVKNTVVDVLGKKVSNDNVEESPYVVEKYELVEQNGLSLTCKATVKNDSFRTNAVLKLTFKRDGNNYTCTENVVREKSSKAISPITTIETITENEKSFVKISDIYPNATVNFDEETQTCKVSDSASSVVEQVWNGTDFVDANNPSDWLCKDEGLWWQVYSFNGNGWVRTSEGGDSNYTSPLIDKTLSDGSRFMQITAMDFNNEQNDGHGDGDEKSGSVSINFTWAAKSIDTSSPTGGTSRMFDMANNPETTEATGSYTGTFSITESNKTLGSFEVSLDSNQDAANLPTSISGTFNENKSITLDWNKDGLLYTGTFTVV
ncbi:hypothetical protein [Raoultibacter phocaeensis]|uniref:hypothetical protein n=1 Tax=Raoultibacter phocaeensis TaxID=2479841 RepID=UPI001119FD26|nr:hypothetical protein [Raoultibacter phocaeensis]